MKKNKKDKNWMISSRQIFLTGILMGLALLGLAGCGAGLPDGVKKDAESVVKGMDTAQKHIQDQKKKFNGLASSKEFTPLAGYAKKRKLGPGL
jgi:hypothetical protein